MTHPFESKREMHPGRKAAAHRMKEYAKGGKVKHDDEAQDRALFKKMMKKEDKGEFKVGGAVSAPRADRFARGGKAKGKSHKGGTHIKIAVVAPHSKPGMDPGAPPMGPSAMMPPGGPPMAPPPGMAPPGAGGPPPPGMPPMKRGGALYNKGGKVPMKSGADSGPGRLEKAKAYGLKPLKKD